MAANDASVVIREKFMLRSVAARLLDETELMDLTPVQHLSLTHSLSGAKCDKKKNKLVNQMIGFEWG